LYVSQCFLLDLFYLKKVQIYFLVLAALYKELGERGNEMENAEYQTKKSEDLQRRLADAHASIYHIEIVSLYRQRIRMQYVFWIYVIYCLFHHFDQQIDKIRLQVHQLNDLDIKRAMAGPPLGVNLDIPESIGLSAALPAPSSSRLVDIDTRRRGKRRL